VWGEVTTTVGSVHIKSEASMPRTCRRTLHQYASTALVCGLRVVVGADGLARYIKDYGCTSYLACCRFLPPEWG
jgi:hypothetical protein